MEFVENKMYRIAMNAENESLRGKYVIFLGWSSVAWFGTRKARIGLVGTDGKIAERHQIDVSNLLRA